MMARTNFILPNLFQLIATFVVSLFSSSFFVWWVTPEYIQFGDAASLIIVTREVTFGTTVLLALELTVISFFVWNVVVIISNIFQSPVISGIVSLYVGALLPYGILLIVLHPACFFDIIFREHFFIPMWGIVTAAFVFCFARLFSPNMQRA